MVTKDIVPPPVLSDGQIELDYFAKAQLYGEIIFHIDGYIAWDFFDGENTENFLYKKCNTIDLYVTDKSVDDERWYINVVSKYIDYTSYWYL